MTETTSRIAPNLPAGCGQKHGVVQKFLSSFDVVWPEETDFAAAYQLLTEHRPASGLSIPDYLIAAMALARSARLYTFNLKHFRIIVGLDSQEPYSR